MCTFGALFSLAVSELGLQEAEMWHVRLKDASCFATKEVHVFFEYSGSPDPRPFILSANCELQGHHVLQFPKTPRHPSFKVRFVVPSLEVGAKPEDGHEIGGCELDLMDLGDEGEEAVVKSLDVQDSTEAVIGFVELEISSYILKVDDDDAPLRPNGLLMC